MIDLEEFKDLTFVSGVVAAEEKRAIGSPAKKIPIIIEGVAEANDGYYFIEPCYADMISIYEAVIGDTEIEYSEENSEDFVPIAMKCAFLVISKFSNIDLERCALTGQHMLSLITVVMEKLLPGFSTIAAQKKSIKTPLKSTTEDSESL